MEILIITLILIFSIWTWSNEKNSKERHDELKTKILEISMDLKEIKSGVSSTGEKGLNPTLFAVSPEVSGIVEQKNSKISELEKDIYHLNKQLKIVRTSLNT